MTIQEHIDGILEIAGLRPEDVHSISIKPGQVEFIVWAKDDEGNHATIETSIGNLPLSFSVVASIGEPDHEHGPHTHTHDDVDA